MLINVPPNAISIIGSGMMGRGLAELWARSGYKITIGSRDPDTVAFLTQDPNIDVDTVDEALKRGTCIVLCIPHTGIRPFVQRYSKYLHSKIVIDVANAVTVSDDLTFLSELGPHTTHGQWLQELLPNTQVIRAFNHIQAELLVSRATKQPGFWGVVVASDKPITSHFLSLISSTGYVAVQFGNLKATLVSEPGHELFPRMYTAGELREISTKLDFGEFC